MKYLVLILIIVTGCHPNPPRVNLTSAETTLLDSLKFDRSIAAELKGITKQTFKRVQISNESGKEIPDYLVPKMISYTVEKSFDLGQINDLTVRAKILGYNIYHIDGPGYITIIASNLNQ